MHIRSTTDPISSQEVLHPEQHPCVYQGDGDDGLEVYFESEENRRQYIDMLLDDDDSIVLKGDASDDYVAEG